MKTKDVLAFLDEWAPFEKAEEWDHVGLQIGCEETEIKKILICLDVTDEAIDTASSLGVNLIISHHPVIFSPLENIEKNSIAYRLIENHIDHIVVHTNMDKAVSGVNDCLCDILDIKDTHLIFDGIGRVGSLSREMTSDEFAKHISEKLSTTVQYCGKENNKIHMVAVVSGGGGDFISELSKDGIADAFVTGEAKHHEWLVAKNLAVFCAGHYATENPIVYKIGERLQEYFPGFEDIIIFEGHSPYKTIK